MSDDKVRKDRGKNPLKKRKVDVEVTPDSGGSYKERQDKERKAREVKKTLKERVEKAVDDAEEQGSDAQFDAAERVLDDDKKAVPKKDIRKIKVRVEGEREDERGKTETVKREREVEPGD